jgi:hypothetical protein
MLSAEESERFSIRFLVADKKGKPKLTGLRDRVPIVMGYTFARISAVLTFRATGITTYLKNGGKLEIAQQMAGTRISPHRRPI